MKNGPYELVVAPEDYPGKKYRGRYCYEHHLVWWQNAGETIGDGECLRHINDNKRDNRFENLEKLNVSKHSRMHSRVGREMVEFECPCGTIFSRERKNTYLVIGGGSSYCSRECAGTYAYRGIKSKILREYKDIQG